MASHTASSPRQPLLDAFIPENLSNDADLYAQGYPRLAYWFSLSPRYLQLRRFVALSIRILLYRQHELVMLERKLIELERKNEDSPPGSESWRRNRDFEALYPQPGETQETAEVRKLYETIDQKTKAYGMAPNDEYRIRLMVHMQRKHCYGSSSWDPNDGIVWALSTCSDAYLFRALVDFRWMGMTTRYGVPSKTHQATPATSFRFFTHLTQAL
ncbi:hypothetical protein BDV95DRAFT_101614 [Massariosphaeria phaeospora]|uniref:DUF6594 domain-containing protein n=1 Tax=Massariosphaeria phaeospora TaxID=100035 RepID=A0A7C8MKP9_9PLEO|nr:hypothetical protein BDV95DRAFT_101614 [Massariosphaeria phaeospora]